MILYHPLLGTELGLYGINLPLRDDRSQSVYEILQKEFIGLSKVAPPVEIEKLPKIQRADLERVHDEKFVQRFFDDEGGFLSETLKTYDCREIYSGEKPLSELRESHLRQVAGTYSALLQSLELGFCFFLGGGMHHGRKSFGSGFCPLNDLVIAIKKAQVEKGLGKVLVIDIDAHQGDGTAEMTMNDNSIDTLSIHMAKGWPLNDDLPPAFSTLDIGVSEGEEISYLKKLDEGLQRFRGGDYGAVFVVAGADPYEHDELPSTQSLKLSKEQMLARDILVYKWCQEEGLPQAWVMAGGYGKEAPQIYAQFLLKVLHLMR